jgi:hypothetical protein
MTDELSDVTNEYILLLEDIVKGHGGLIVEERRLTLNHVSFQDLRGIASQSGVVSGNEDRPTITHALAQEGYFAVKTSPHTPAVVCQYDSEAQEIRKIDY